LKITSVFDRVQFVELRQNIQIHADEHFLNQQTSFRNKAFRAQKVVRNLGFYACQAIILLTRTPHWNAVQTRPGSGSLRKSCPRTYGSDHTLFQCKSLLNTSNSEICFILCSHVKRQNHIQNRILEPVQGKNR
jgi:hypothetical protein